jgi:outer membrane protein OmpA-like peptidoglycan-associated protein
MHRYFRCEEPTQQCPHARTREVQVDQDGVCPSGNPDCERYRRPVPWWTAIPERHPRPVWVGAGLLGLFAVVLLLSAVLGGGGWRVQIAALQTDLSDLGRRLTEVESLSVPTPEPAPPTANALRHLTEQVQQFAQAVDGVVRAGTTQEVPRLQAEYQGLVRQLAAAAAPAVAGDPGGVRQSMGAAQLVRDFEGLEARAETARSVVAPTGGEAAEQALSELIGQVRDGMRRARRLAAPIDATPPSPGDPVLVQRLANTLESARERLNRLPPDAGLVIATSPGLAESLVIPLLQARWGGAVTLAPGAQRWLLASSSPEIAPGVLVTAAADDPYGSLIDGSADLVITDRPADAAVGARFSNAFPGQSIDSRAYSEVIALDAVALLGHPSAPTSAIGVAQLRQGPWAARATDTDAIARLTAAAVAMVPVENPLLSVLAAPNARAVALFHQCGPNLAARYLPYQPATEVQALAPSPFSIATEDYGLAFRITAAHSPSARPAARQFIDYLTSDAGQDRIADAGFVDLRLRHEESSVDPRLRAVLGAALGLKSITSASRYSTNLRFGVNEHKLDIKAEADIQRLPRALARDFPTGKVVILGFTDSTGTPETNLPLSIERAKHIAERLQQFSIPAAQAGLGQQMPLASNDTEQGRARNRRAEVWVVK